MSENNDEPQTRVRAENNRDKKNKKTDAQTPALVALLKDPAKRTEEAETSECEPSAYSPDVPAAPFPDGAKIKFIGTRRLFAGWYNESILEPGSRFVVGDVAGPYSVITARISGQVYRMALTSEDSSDWVVE